MGKAKKKPTAISNLRSMNEPLTRKRESTSSVFIEFGDEWEELVSMLANERIGLYQRYILHVTPEMLESHPSLRAVARPIKNFVERHYGKKYRVRQMDSKEEGPVVAVEHPGPGA
jgi:hypothetical protein